MARRLTKSRKSTSRGGKRPRGKRSTAKRPRGERGASTAGASAAEIESLRLRLGEAEEALEAIRTGQAESLVVEGPGGPRIFSLEGADHSYRVLVEAINEGAATLGEDGTILYCNERFAELCNESLERVMGEPIHRFLPDGSKAPFAAMLREAEQGGGRGEVEIQGRGGQEIPVFLSVSVIREGDRRRYCVVASDMRAQKHNEEILASERLAQSVFAQAADGIVVCDGSGRILRASDSAIELGGDNPLFAPFDSAFPLRLEDEPQGRPSVVARAMAGEELSAVAASLSRPDGSTAELLVSARRLHGKGDRILGCVVTMVDVTAHRRTEKALRDSEALLRSFFDSPGHSHGIVEISENDILFLSTNPASASALGLTPAEMSGKWASELGASDETIRLWLGHYRESRQRNQAVRFELQRTVDKKLLWLSATVSFLGGGAGGRPRFAYSMWDITERKRTELALEEMKNELEVRVQRRTGELAAAMTLLEREQRRFKDVLDMLPAYVVLLAPDFHVPFANRFFEERFGKAEGRLCYQYLFGRTSPCENCESFKAFETQAPHHWEWTGPDGRDYDIHDFPFSDVDGAPLVLEMGIDVTDKKRAEAAVQRERQRLFDVLDSLPAMVCLLTTDYRVAFGNRKFRKQFGEPAGRHCYQQCFGKTAPCDFCESYQVLKTGQPHRWEVRVPNGDIIIEAHDFPFTDVDGSPLILEMDIDITERKRTEATLRDWSEKLEQRVAERTAELRDANRRLEEADRRKDEFLAVLSHELRNPLMPITSSLYLLKHAPPGGAQAGRAMDVIGRQLGHLSHLVNDLLDVTRVSRNKIQLQRRLVDLRDLVRRSVDDQRTLFEAAGVALESTLPPEAVMVDADTNRIAQVVGNLLQNAAKFTPRGGWTSIEVSRHQERGQALVRVRDSGVGMAPETVPGLFQAFVQADHTLDRSKGGLGLGLALVKGLVEMHAGEVSAHSDGLGKGSEFLVRLPLDEKAAAQPQAPSDGHWAPGRRILVIEDNQDAAESLQDVLELDGHEVRVARNGPEGIALAKACQPEVVLCDIGLPEMDGYEVARVLRSGDSPSQAVLVALSGYARPEDIERALEAGFDRHLAKPPSLEALKDLLAHAADEIGDGESITVPMATKPED